MLYEFECKKCSEQFEVIRKLEENSDTAECPKCKGKAKKILSKFGFSIKGFSQLNGYSSANR